jgi:hypothetical protein
VILVRCLPEHREAACAGPLLSDQPCPRGYWLVPATGPQPDERDVHDADRMLSVSVAAQRERAKLGVSRVGHSQPTNRNGVGCW